MARAFIDAKLLPKHLDSIFFQDIWDSEVKMAEQLPEPMKSQQLFEINKKHRALKLSDLEWAEVYRMFQDLYFPKWGVSTATARLYLNVVNSVGWTLVILLALCPSYRHWPMIAGAILLTFLGILMTVAVLFNVVQVSAVWPSLLCARMLKDILRLKHSDADAASQSELE
jgi:hypothetical protein